MKIGAIPEDQKRGRETFHQRTTTLGGFLALGLDILDSGFRPDFIVGVWGAPGGDRGAGATARLFGVDTDHISIRTSPTKVSVSA